MPRIRPKEGHILRALGKLITRQRRARGLSQRDLATLIGVGKSTVQSYESGSHNPPFDKLVLIAHQCDLSLSAFLAPLDTFAVDLPELKESA